jgi:hypothetical protein
MDAIARLSDVVEIVEHKETLLPRRIGVSDVGAEYEADAIAF